MRREKCGRCVFWTGVVIYVRVYKYKGYVWIPRPPGHMIGDLPPFIGILLVPLFQSEHVQVNKKIVRNQIQRCSQDQEQVRERKTRATTTTHKSDLKAKGQTTPTRPPLDPFKPHSSPRMPKPNPRYTTICFPYSFRTLSRLTVLVSICTHGHTRGQCSRAIADFWHRDSREMGLLFERRRG